MDVRARRLLFGLGFVATCAAGGKKRPEPEVPPPVIVEAPPPPAPDPPRGPMWPTRPTDAGPLPAGLGNPTSSGCAGCHAVQTARWRASGHAHSAARADALAAADPGCPVCHLPLIAQQERHGDQPNLGFDLALWADGVGCAACHLRDGAVVATAPGTAPHALAWSPELDDPAACATCHQLAWPGADVPLYDTVGEWSRSGWSGAGVGCIDCHGAHAVTLPFDRAVSVLVEAPGRRLRRGGPPLAFAVALQNTGAGHAVPTGSPYAGLRLEIALEGPVGKRGEIGVRGTPVTADFGRTVSDAPPWRVLADTRLAPGATRRVEAPLSLPADAAVGPWNVRVRVLRTTRGAVGDLASEQRIPMQIE